MPQEKQCQLCNEIKNVTDFSPNGPRLHSRCKKCRTKIQQERARKKWKEDPVWRKKEYERNRKNSIKKNLLKPKHIKIIKDCNKLVNRNPELINEWHYKKNEGLDINNISYGSSKKVWWVGKCGHEWKTRISVRSSGSSCPFCNESKGETKIKNVLDNMNIKYIREYQIKDCKYKLPLRFDFCIIEKNNVKFLIEFNGIQHYKPIPDWGDEKGLEECIKRDKIKTQYCFDNNIFLLIIPYWDINKTEDKILEAIEKVKK